MPILKFTFRDTTWDETPLPSAASTGLRFARVRLTTIYSGDLVGAGIDESTFCYHPAPEGEVSCTFFGVVHFKGTVKGEEGEAVFLTRGQITKEEGPRTEYVMDGRSAIGAFKGTRRREVIDC